MPSGRDIKVRGGHPDPAADVVFALKTTQPFSIPTRVVDDMMNVQDPVTRLTWSRAWAGLRMRCVECGALVAEATQVCPECGAPPVGRRSAADPAVAGAGADRETVPAAYRR